MAFLLLHNYTDFIVKRQPLFFNNDALTSAKLV